MSQRSALVVFPEGGNWTPVRWRRAIDRLRRRGRPDLAERAAAMPNVLPPHAAGALAAIAACPRADVIFVAHTGLDRLVSVRDVWRSLLDRHGDPRPLVARPGGQRPALGEPRHPGHLALRLVGAHRRLDHRGESLVIAYESGLVVPTT